MIDRLDQYIHYIVLSDQLVLIMGWNQLSQYVDREIITLIPMIINWDQSAGIIITMMILFHSELIISIFTYFYWDNYYISLKQDHYSNTDEASSGQLAAVKAEGRPLTTVGAG